MPEKVVTQCTIKITNVNIAITKKVFFVVASIGLEVYIQKGNLNLVM